MKPLPGLQVTGPWTRLHRSEASPLAAFLTEAEREAVARRTAGARGPAPLWVPPTSGAWGGRFTPPQGPGSLYLASDLATCLDEVAHHHARACQASLGTPPGARATFRPLRFEVEGRFADASADRRKRLHAPEDYGPSWAYGLRARADGWDGVHYRSVRHRGGWCLAVYREQAVHFLEGTWGAVILEWDGVRSVRIA
ncbi:MAG TPA: RES family NAD+ phosphorylase [Holophaga sp.]|nr:RES family NAD+ phosphorylase [Holophaga sp.]